MKTAKGEKERRINCPVSAEALMRLKLEALRMEAATGIKYNIGSVVTAIAMAYLPGPSAAMTDNRKRPLRATRPADADEPAA